MSSNNAVKYAARIIGLDTGAIKSAVNPQLSTITLCSFHVGWQVKPFVVSLLGRTVLLDGTTSKASGNGTLAYHWFGPFGRAGGATPLVRLPLGQSVVSLIVGDGDGSSRADFASIRVRPCFKLGTKTGEGSLWVQLNWLNRPDAEHYDIYRATGENPTAFTKIGESRRSSFRDTTVLPNTTFLYLVDAYNQGVSCYSRVLPGRDGICIPFRLFQ